jgi:hypothetical protein
MDPTVVITSAGKGDAIEMPTEFALLGNYPNPFNPSTSIRYRTPEDGVVLLAVYDILGRSVTQIQLGMQSGGEHSYRFEGSNLSSGVYFYQLRLVGTAAGKKFATPYSKMTLLK